MEIVIKGDAKEIAALALAVQERQHKPCKESVTESIGKCVIECINEVASKGGPPILLI